MVITRSYFFAIACAFFLIFLSASRPIGLDRDSIAYSHELQKPLEEINFSSKEPTFWLLQQLNFSLFDGGAASFFLLYAILGVFIKFLVIYKVSPFPVLSIFVYFAFFFILHEMTQIRAGIAVGLVFWSMTDVIERNRNKFVFKILLAIFFHYSAIVFLALYFVRARFNNKSLIIYSALPLVGVLLMYANFFEQSVFWLSGYLPAFLGYKIDIYFQLKEQDGINFVNPLNFGNISLLVALYFALFKVFYLNDKQYFGYAVVALSVKWLSIGFFVLFSFSFMEVFAYRMANYLFFSLVVVLPFVFTRFKPAVFSVSLLLIYLAYNLFSTMQMLNFEVLS